MCSNIGYLGFLLDLMVRCEQFYPDSSVLMSETLLYQFITLTEYKSLGKKIYQTSINEAYVYTYILFLSVAIAVLDMLSTMYLSRSSNYIYSFFHTHKLHKPASY